MNFFEQVCLKADELLIPLLVHFDLTYRCHQRCVHCFIPETWRRGAGPEPELDTAQVNRILDQLASAGAFFLDLSGGEIFLRPDIFDILEHARRLDFSISIYTTGTVGLGRDEIRRLAELGIHGVLFSCYSLDPAVHDAITRVPGSWKKMLSSVNECRSQGLIAVFNCPALALNFPTIIDLQEFAVNEGIPLRIADKLSPRWDGSPHLPGLTLNREQVREVRRIRDRFDQDEGVQEIITAFRRDGLMRCSGGFNSCYISAYGEVWPCIDLPIVWGSLKGDGAFGPIWKNSALRRQLLEVNQKTSPLGQRPCDVCQGIPGSSEIWL